MAINTFMGKPCKRGHGGERYIANKTCVQCNNAQVNAYARNAGKTKKQASNLKYAKTEKGIAVRKKAVAKYHASQKGQAVRAKARHDRRARERGATGRYSPEQLVARLLAFHHTCCVPFCGQPYQHLDHGIPLANGGSNKIDNIFPMCAMHNMVKHTEEIGGFVLGAARAEAQKAGLVPWK